MSNLANELLYYLDRKPTFAEIAEAEEWQQDHPGSNLSEYVDAMIEIGAL
jgi:hypothetical protein